MMNREKGAALIEYVLVIPFVLLLFLGVAEVFRVISIKQSLRAALQQELPCLTHAKDWAYWRDHCSSASIAERIEAEVARNPLAQVRSVVVTPKASPDEAWIIQNSGLVFEVTAEATAQYAFLYPFRGGPEFVVRESVTTFIDSDPSWFGMNPENKLSVPEPMFAPTTVPQP